MTSYPLLLNAASGLAIRRPTLAPRQGTSYTSGTSRHEIIYDMVAV